MGKLKISKSMVLFLVLGMFVVVLASLFMSYRGQEDTQSKLNEDLALVELRLSKLPAVGLTSQVQDLQNQEAKLKSDIKKTKTDLTQAVVMKSREITDTIFNLAESSGVSISEFELTDPAMRKIEKMDFLAMTGRMNINGDVPKIISFVTSVNQKYPTSEIGLVNLVIPEIIPGQEPEKPHANVEMRIYSYEGD